MVDNSFVRRTRAGGCPATSVRGLSVLKQPAVYILASSRYGTLYACVTSNLVQRVWQHREHLAAGFTDTYNVTLLVYYGLHVSMEAAISCEKQIKKWRRA